MGDEVYSISREIKKWEKTNHGKMLSYDQFKNLLWKDMDPCWIENPATLSELKVYFRKNEKKIREEYDEAVKDYKELLVEFPDGTDLNIHSFGARLDRLGWLLNLDF